MDRRGAVSKGRDGQWILWMKEATGGVSTTRAQKATAWL